MQSKKNNPSLSSISQIIKIQNALTIQINGLQKKQKFNNITTKQAQENFNQSLNSLKNLTRETKINIKNIEKHQKDLVIAANQLKFSLLNQISDNCQKILKDHRNPDNPLLISEIFKDLQQVNLIQSEQLPDFLDQIKKTINNNIKNTQKEQDSISKRYLNQ